jgi:muramoyltetrapeptide carboxypeptidase
VDEEPYTWSEWLRVITGDASLPHAIPNADPYTCLQPGQAEGILMGGNLSLLAALCGTPYQPDTTGAILFIEDWHERYYSLDRQFRQLKLSGLLDNLAGLVLCDFSETDEPETSPTLAEFFAGLIKSLDLNPSIPIGLGYSVGHGAHTATMSIGTRASFDSLSGRVMLLESPVLRPA